MNKLELANGYAKIMLKNAVDSNALFSQDTDKIVNSLILSSFNLAEGMLAENEKRQDKSRPEVLNYPEFDADVWYCDGAKVLFNGYVMEASMAKILFNNMAEHK